ncbi:hypothetical protein FA09DRAFT_84990 [Tilletiopsis washingtonensis]|uniref:Uncharacterized protein n=1 Tax=Tilletiopsis washingtonensis TaxID=58919 RepID=A0A316Z729_9BASI|nr:hypothetical protein FA09DRAFT_84990 [Tilletiopsis washingtonensis]PWN96752.1 hypothetical protein FA09DRAFT_84990 [Tilletiopsis washingtonensis]
MPWLSYDRRTYTFRAFSSFFRGLPLSAKLPLVRLNVREDAELGPPCGILSRSTSGHHVLRSTRSLISCCSGTPLPRRFLLSPCPPSA